MTESPLSATRWEAVQHNGRLIYKHQNTDSFCMDFENNVGVRIQVVVTAQELKRDFDEHEGVAKKVRTEKILRAIFETYVEHFEPLPATVTFRDLGSHQESARTRFSLSLGDAT
jgi:uncharacterized linocin/CFP29 family protein